MSEKRTISVFLCRDRRLNVLAEALKEMLGPEAYFQRPPGGGIDIGDSQCFYSFARKIKTLQHLETGLIIALTHNDCHHCRVNHIIRPGNDEILTLKQIMTLAGENIKKDFPTMKVITGIIHTEEALFGDLQSIELIAPYNDSSFLCGSRCTKHLHHNAFHDIAT